MAEKTIKSRETKKQKADKVVIDPLTNEKKVTKKPKKTY